MLPTYDFETSGAKVIKIFLTSELIWGNIITLLGSMAVYAYAPICSIVFAYGTAFSFYELKSVRKELAILSSRRFSNEKVGT